MVTNRMLNTNLPEYLNEKCCLDCNYISNKIDFGFRYGQLENRFE